MSDVDQAAPAVETPQAQPLAEDKPDNPSDWVDLDGALVDPPQADVTKPEPAPAPEPEVVEPEEDTGEEEDDEEEEEPPLAATEKPAKKQSGIHRLKAELADAKAENERLRRSVPAVDEKEALEAAVVAKIGPMPKESDYTDYLEYTEDRQAWKAAAIIQRVALKDAQADVKARADREIALRQEDLNRKMSEAEKVDPTIREVLAKATVSPVHPDTAQMILDSPKAVWIARHYSLNPRDCTALNNMSPLAQAREIGRLEASLRPPVKQQTKAPAPVPALKGGVVQQKDPDEMTVAEVDAYFTKLKKQKQG
ncbi:MAG: hypothetical protein PHT59_07860 [Candidatus Omnitrophica bacterium]|nr:hypothetical protein [Candidatus Omnitrophota bacterium]